MDINCDMGEGIGNERLLMPFINSANIACGYHAGDDETMQEVIMLCLKYDVHIGAHPSFFDRENFGRTEIHLPTAEIYGLVSDQLLLMNKIVRQCGGRLHHVKPHGALYNMAAKDPVLAATIAKAVKDFDDSLVFYGLSGSVMITEAATIGLQTANEVFADRTYQPDGSLTPRSLPNALITDNEIMLNQLTKFVEENKVITSTGKEIELRADTICIHGDGEHALAFVKSIYKKLHEK